MKFSRTTTNGSRQWSTAYATAFGLEAGALTFKISLVLGLLFFQNISQATQSTAAPNVKSLAKSFLEPEAGLNTEIRAALSRLEVTCQYLKEGSRAPSVTQSGSSNLLKEIESAKKLAIEQRSVAEKSLDGFQESRQLNTSSCAALPNVLRLSDQCKQYQIDIDKWQVVKSTTTAYFDETLARFGSYEAAIKLEGRGCTRPGFSNKLWAAEQEHIVPKLKNSGRTLSEMLK